jgi:hypothetical protein
MNKPYFNFFIIAGMPRAGTTFLYHNLQKHPQIFLPYRKETNYFSFNSYKGLEWFEDLYKGIKDDQIGGDISPFYFLDERSIVHLKELCGDRKIIIVVRDPVEFSISAYSQVNTYSPGKLVDFPGFLEYFKIDFDKSSIEFSLKNRGVDVIIDSYRKAFERNLLLINFELLRKDSLLFLRNIEKFIGVPHYFNRGNFDNMLINASNRRNNKLLTKLMMNEKFIYFLNLCLPRKMLRLFRYWFDHLSARNKSNDCQYNNIPSDILLLAEDLFARQRGYISEIFKHSSVVNGLLEPVDYLY